MEPETTPSSGTMKYIIGIIAIGIIIVAVSLYGRAKTPSDIKESAQSEMATEQKMVGNATGNSAGAEVKTTSSATTVEVVYTDTDGFTPDKVSINTGDTVKFTNKSTDRMWVGSDEHPTHMEYDGTNLKSHCAAGATASFDQCAAETEYSFTFTKAGSFDYHNHARASMRGTVTVK